MDAGAIVISVLIEVGGGAKSFKSGRKPAFGTWSLRRASAMSHAVYFSKAWSCSLVAPDEPESVPIVRRDMGLDEGKVAL